MQYEVLYINEDNLTAKVRMTINDSILEQDFALGANADEFHNNILDGMAVFQAELNMNTPPPVDPPAFALNLINQPVSIDQLP